MRGIQNKVQQHRFEGEAEKRTKVVGNPLEAFGKFDL